MKEWVPLDLHGWSWSYGGLTLAATGQYWLICRGHQIVGGREYLETAARKLLKLEGDPCPECRETRGHHRLRCDWPYRSPLTRK